VASAGEHAQTNGLGAILVNEFENEELPVDVMEFIEEETTPIEIIEPEITPEMIDPDSNEQTTPKEHSSIRSESSSSRTDESGEGFNMGGSAGTALLNGQVYTRVRIMPELVIGKFGIGLDLDLLIDGDGQIRKEDWDDFEDYLAKILYLRYGHRGDPFFGKIGGFTE